MSIIKELSIVSNASISKLLNPDLEAKKIAIDILSYFVLGYEKTISYKNNRWDGKSSMFDWEKNTFPSGFLETVKGSLIEAGYKITHIRKDLPPPLGDLHTKLGKFDFTGIYEYQIRNTQELEKRGGMISHLATGAGKTNAAAIAIKRIKRNTLILTKRQPLMYQFKERLEPFGLDAGLVGDSIFNLKPELTVAMVKTLNNRIEAGDQEVIDYLKSVEFIIGEEAHEVSDNAYWNVLMHCTNAYYKMALTATPFMRINSEANMKLLGAFGPLGISVDEKTLIDRGILAKPIIKFTSYERPEGLKYGSNYQRAIELGIVGTNPASKHALTGSRKPVQSRNEKIASEVAKAKEHGLSSLILVQRKEHGKVLEEILLDLGIKVRYLFGETKSNIRREVLNQLANGEIDAIIGSTIVDVGVDVPSIGLVINAGAGKAETAYRQRIGRGLRKKATGPNVCFFMDFEDSHNEYLYQHYRERLGIIKATEGFRDCLIGPEEAFPYHLFKKI